MEKKGWLGQRIEEAQKEKDRWPEWMKASAKFEGSRREDDKPHENNQASNPKIQKRA